MKTWRLHHLSQKYNAKIQKTNGKINQNTIFFVKKTLFFHFLNAFSQKFTIFVAYIIKVQDMYTKDLNRLKVVLAEKKRTNKWLAEQLGKAPATVSKWCTNSAQPNLENLMDIARCLEVNVNELLRM